MKAMCTLIISSGNVYRKCYIYFLLTYTWEPIRQKFRSNKSKIVRSKYVLPNVKVTAMFNKTYETQYYRAIWNVIWILEASMNLF